MSEYFNRKRTDPIPEVNGSILPEYLQGDLKLTMWIPAEYAGKVIGKKGTVISHIQRETKARLLNALPVVGDSLWIAIAIVGEWSSLVAAYKTISEIVFGEVDDVVLEFMINYRRSFFLYGRYKYDAVKYISAMSNVRILMPEFDPKEQKFSDAAPVTLEGSFENVIKAIALFEQEALHYVEQKEKRRIQVEIAEEKEKSKARAVTKVVEIERRPLERPRPLGPPAIPVTALSTTKAGAPSSSSAPLGNINKVGDRRERESKRPEIVVRKEPPVVEEKKEPIIETEEPPKVKIIRSIEVPANVVGLLLVKRVGTKTSTMGTIMRNSRTTIRKSLTPIAKVAGEVGSTIVEDKVGENTSDAAKGSEEIIENGTEDEDGAEDNKDRRRRRRAAEDEDNAEEDSSDSEEEDDEGEESDEEVESEDDKGDNNDEKVDDEATENGETDVEKVAETSKEEVAEPAAFELSASAAVTTKPERAKKVYSQDPVFFDICGYEPHVDLAYDTLVRIIKGDRIKEVMATMTKLPPLKNTIGKERKERPLRATNKPAKEKLSMRDSAIAKKERPVRGKKGPPAAAASDDTANKATSKSGSWQRSVPLPNEKPAAVEGVPLDAPVVEREDRGRGGRGRGRGRSSGRGGGRIGSKPAAATSASATTE